VSKINKQTANEKGRGSGGKPMPGANISICLPADKSQTTPWKKAKNRVWIGPQIGQIAEKTVAGEL